MRVLLDATAIPPQRTGVGWYVTGLAAALARRDDVDLHVVTKRRDAEDLARRAPGADIHAAGPQLRPSRIVWEQTGLPLRSRRLGPDVFHGPHYTVPPKLRTTAVVTFHDPTFFTMPEVHERAKVAYFTRMSRVGVRRAERVLAVSDYARRGAIEYAGADPDRTDVVVLGVDHDRYRPDADLAADARLRERAGVRGPYVLFVGALEPRKDVPTLIRAFSEVVSSGFDGALVLAGLPAWGSSEIDAVVAASPVASRVVRTGYVSEEEKIALLRGCGVFAYPSLAEGFGIPVLEAMACGAPVITTTGSACEEVGGDAVELVEPRATTDLAAALERILGDAAHADDLRRRGVGRASAYTWDATAAATVECYRKAIR